MARSFDPAALEKPRTKAQYGALVSYLRQAGEAAQRDDVTAELLALMNLSSVVRQRLEDLRDPDDEPAPFLDPHALPEEKT